MILNFVPLAPCLDLAMKIALMVHDEAGFGDIYVP